MSAPKTITNAPRLNISRFSTAFPTGPAFGTQEFMTWRALATMLANRREGGKDGPNFVPATFKPEPDGRIRRLKGNLLRRTAVALDCETSKQTGEIPPPIGEVTERIKAKGWAAVVYSSHNHTPAAPRYRIVLPLAATMAPTLPAVEVIAEALALSGVLDTSKIGAASLFYLPSAVPGDLERHETREIDGAPIDHSWLTAKAEAVLAAREAEKGRQRAQAMEAAIKRRAERIRQGFDPTDSIIQKVRNHLDLTGELLRHGYRQVDEKFLFPRSETGVPGVHVMRGSDGVERVYSHHAADPLAAGNLPARCTVKAVDAVDVVAILDHGGDLKAMLRASTKRFGLLTPREPPAPPDRDQPPTRHINKGCSDSDEPGPMPGGGEESGSTTLGNLASTNPATLEGVDIPERHWIVQDWMPVGHVTLNYGDGGTGKTLAAQQLMTSCATGKPWLGLAVRECRTFGLFCEDDGAELHRRQEAICDACGLRFADLGNMRWVSAPGEDNVLVTFEADGTPKLTARFSDLRDAAVAFGAQLVVIDTAADTFGGNENDRAQVRQFIGHVLTRLARDIGGAVLLNAHPSRSGMSSTGDLDGGSTGWSNSARSRWALARLTGEGVPQDTPERLLTRRKANYAAMGTQMKLRWHAGVLVPVERPGGAFGAVGHNVAAETVFLELLSKCRTAGVTVSHSKNATNSAARVFSSRADRQGFSRRDFEGAMNRLLEMGKIRVATHGRRGQERQHLEAVTTDIEDSEHAA